MSSLPRQTTTSTGGTPSSESPWCSMTARIAFLNSSNSMWYKWEGTYTMRIGAPCSTSREGGKRKTIRKKKLHKERLCSSEL